MTIRISGMSGVRLIAQETSDPSYWAETNYAIALDADTITYRVLSLINLIALKPVVTQNGDNYKVPIRRGFFNTSTEYLTQVSLNQMFNGSITCPGFATLPITSSKFDQLIDAGVIEIGIGLGPAAMQDTVSSSKHGRTAKFKGGYVVAKTDEASGNLQFALVPKVHDTNEQAQAEADRLARNHNGCEFVVFEAVSATVRNEVVTRKFD